MAPENSEGKYNNSINNPQIKPLYSSLSILEQQKVKQESIKNFEKYSCTNDTACTLEVLKIINKIFEERNLAIATTREQTITLGQNISDEYLKNNDQIFSEISHEYRKFTGMIRWLKEASTNSVDTENDWNNGIKQATNNNAEIGKDKNFNKIKSILINSGELEKVASNLIEQAKKIKEQQGEECLVNFSLNGDSKQDFKFSTKQSALISIRNALKFLANVNENRDLINYPDWGTFLNGYTLTALIASTPYLVHGFMNLFRGKMDPNGEPKKGLTGEAILNEGGKAIKSGIETYVNVKTGGALGGVAGKITGEILKSEDKPEYQKLKSLNDGFDVADTLDTNKKESIHDLSDRRSYLEGVRLIAEYLGIEESEIDKKLSKFDVNDPDNIIYKNTTNYWIELNRSLIDFLHQYETINSTDSRQEKTFKGAKNIGIATLKVVKKLNYTLNYYIYRVNNKKAVGRAIKEFFKEQLRVQQEIFKRDYISGSDSKEKEWTRGKDYKHIEYFGMNEDAEKNIKSLLGSKDSIGLIEGGKLLRLINNETVNIKDPKSIRNAFYSVVEYLAEGGNIEEVKKGNIIVVNYNDERIEEILKISERNHLDSIKRKYKEIILDKEGTENSKQLKIEKLKKEYMESFGKTEIDFEDNIVKLGNTVEKQEIVKKYKKELSEIKIPYTNKEIKELGKLKTEIENLIDDKNKSIKDDLKSILKDVKVKEKEVYREYYQERKNNILTSSNNEEQKLQSLKTLETTIKGLTSIEDGTKDELEKTVLKEIEAEIKKLKLKSTEELKKRRSEVKDATKGYGFDKKLELLKELKGDLDKKIEEKGLDPNLEKELKEILKQVKQDYAKIINDEYKEDKIKDKSFSDLKKLKTDLEAKANTMGVNAELKALIGNVEKKYVEKVTEYYTSRLNSDKTNSVKIEKLLFDFESEFKKDGNLIIPSENLKTIHLEIFSLNKSFIDEKSKASIKEQREHETKLKQMEIEAQKNNNGTQPIINIINGGQDPHKTKNEASTEQVEALKENSILKLVKKFKLYVSSDMSEVVIEFEKRYKKEFKNKTEDEIKIALSNIYNGNFDKERILTAESEKLFKLKGDLFDFEKLGKVKILGNKLVVHKEDVLLFEELDIKMRECRKMEEELEKLEKEKGDSSKIGNSKSIEDKISILRKSIGDNLNDIVSILERAPDNIAKGLKEEIKKQGPFEKGKSKGFFEAINESLKKFELKKFKPKL